MSNEGYKEDYYFVLGVREDADQEEVRAAHRRLMKQFHSDLNRENPRAHERGKLINEAYDVLKDPAQRRAYDDWLRQSSASGGSHRSHKERGWDGGQGPSGAPQDDHGPGQGGNYEHGDGGKGASSGPPVPAQKVLEGWYLERSGFRRWLLPEDLLEATEFVGHEAFYPERITTDYLGRKVSEKSEEVTKDRWGEYELNPQDLEYVPDEFKKETITAVTSGLVHDCGSCGGQGRTGCPPTENCPTYVRCRNCSGRGVQVVSCVTCDGDGTTTYTTQDFDIRTRRCRSCGGSGEEARYRCQPCDGDGSLVCGTCGGRGQVLCRKCGGRGYLECKKCGTHGQLLKVRIVTHSFSPRSKESFQGLAKGLSPKEFSGLSGRLVGEQEQTPESVGDVRQRQSTERFQVDSFRYQCGDHGFFLNLLSGVEAYERVHYSGGLPLSDRSVRVLGTLAIALVIAGLATGMYFWLWPIVFGA